MLKKLLFLFLLSLCSTLYAKQININESPDSLMIHGAWGHALQKIELMPDLPTRQAILRRGVERMPATMTLTPEEILKIINLYQGTIHGEMQNRLLQQMAQVIIESGDPKHKVLLDGFKKYCGNDTEKRNKLFLFLNEHQRLLELQSEFLPDFDTAFAQKNGLYTSMIINYHLKRAKLSGRDIDALKAFNTLNKVLSDSALILSQRIIYENELLLLSSMVASELFDPFLIEYVQKNPNSIERTLTHAFSQIKTQINSSLNRRDPQHFLWVEDYARLKRVFDQLYNQNIPTWSQSSRDNMKRQLDTLWRETLLQITRKNDENLRRYRMRYSREISDKDLLKARHANAFLGISPDVINFENLDNDTLTLIGLKIQLLCIAERFDDALVLIAQMNASPIGKSYMLQQSNVMLERMINILNPNFDENQNNTKSSNANYYNGNQLRNAIALTRLRQKRNLKTVKTVIQTLDKIGIRPPFNKIILIFDAVHSMAETYKYEDLVAVFGEPEEMSEADVLALGKQILSKLQRQWQTPDIQLKMNTKRTENETLLMANRGFSILDKFLKKAIQGRAGQGYLIYAFRGSMLYQWSGFMQKNKMTEQEISTVQKEALSSIEKAANRYIKMVPNLYQSDYTVEVFTFWFDAFMQSTKHKKSIIDRPNLALIRQSIQKMSPDAAQKHLEMIAEELQNRLLTQKPNERQNFLFAALELIEGTEQAKLFQDRLDYYTELLDEAHLVPTVYTQNGVVSDDMIAFTLYLNHTAEIARESGGFNRYLTIGGNPYNMLALGMSAETSIANRESLETQIYDSLQDKFEVVSITFSEPNIASIERPDGLLALPLATLLIRPITETIDCLPAIKIELEFSDAGELVILPVISTPVPIKMVKSQDIPIPEDLTLRQRVNFINLAEGRIRLDVTAQASRLMGGWDSIFPSRQFEGLILSDLEENVATCTKMAVENNQMITAFERQWVLHLKIKDAKHIPQTFYFPVPKKALSNSCSYTHDVNFISCEESAPMTFSKTPVTIFEKTFNKLLMMIGIFVLFFLLVIYWIFRHQKHRSLSVTEAPKSPFALHRLLLKILEDGRGTNEERVLIQENITKIELAYFSATGVALSEKELKHIFQLFQHLIPIKSINNQYKF